MDTFLPVLTTASVFSAILAIDVIRKRFDYLPVHVVLAVLSVAIMSYIANNVSVPASWALLLAPFLFVFLGLFMQMSIPPHSSNHAPTPFLITNPAAPPVPASSPSATTPSASCGGPVSSCLNPASVKSA